METSDLFLPFNVFTVSLIHYFSFVTPLILAWWGFCEQKTLTQVAGELRVDDGVVTEWFTEALQITAHDAMVREAAVEFGKRGPIMTDIEATETCLQSWNVPSALGEFPQHYFFVVVGIRERGDMDKIGSAIPRPV